MRILKRLTAILTACTIMLGMSVLIPRKKDMLQVEAVENDLWKDSYADYLREYQKNIGASRFMTVFIDGDEIPEIVISRSWVSMSPVDVISYCNDSVVELGTFSQYGTLYYKEKENIFFSKVGGTGVYKACILSIDNGFATERNYFSYDTYNNDTYTAAGISYDNADDFNEACKAYNLDDWLCPDSTWNSISYENGMVDITEANIDKYIGKTTDPFVQAHLNFIEENPDVFINAEDSYILAETKRLMYEYDSEITRYNGLKSVQNLIGGDIDTDTFNAELTAQAILADLLCSEETLAAMENASKKAEDTFLIQALDIFLKNATLFKIDGTDLAELTVLCETEDKSSAEFMLKCKEWIHDFIPSVEMDVLSMYFDATGKSGENLLLKVGKDVIETSEKYMDFCIAVRAYNASDNCLREALDKLLGSMLVEYYMVQDGIDAESVRIKLVVDEFQKQYLSVINTSDTKYDEYASSLITRLATNTASQAVAAISKELLLTAAKIACPTLGAVLGAMDLAFSIGMNVWEILSNVDERALERDMFLNMLVYYDAIVNAMSGTIKDSLLTKKTLEAAYTYEEGFCFYQKITSMMVEHGKQYYSMMYKNISLMGYTEDEFYTMAEQVEGLLGTAYAEKMIATLEDQKHFWMNDIQLEAHLKTVLSYVKPDMLNEISNRIFSLELLADDTASMSCHDLIVSSEPVTRPDFYVYDVACPVNLTIKNGNNIVAEVTEDALTMHGETTPVSVNLIKEEGDTYASKFVVVPMGYDVEITGYADGTMCFEKAVVENGFLSTLSAITDVPVQTGSVYTEVLEEGITVALVCDLDGDGTTDQTLSAEVLENTLAMGDLNADTNIDASDAAMILVAAANVGAGSESGLSANQQAAADVDDDGSFNAIDAARILRYAAAAGAGYTGSFADFLAEPAA